MPVFIVLVSVGGSRYHYYVSDSRLALLIVYIQLYDLILHCQRCWLNEDGAIWGFIGPMLLIIVVSVSK